MTDEQPQTTPQAPEQHTDWRSDHIHLAVGRSDTGGWVWALWHGQRFAADAPHQHIDGAPLYHNPS